MCIDMLKMSAGKEPQYCLGKKPASQPTKFPETLTAYITCINEVLC